jgi:hypothetical protein
MATLVPQKTIVGAVGRLSHGFVAPPPLAATVNGAAAGAIVGFG